MGNAKYSARKCQILRLVRVIRLKYFTPPLCRNSKIPTQEELNLLSNSKTEAEPEVDRASMDKNLQLVRDELVQSYVWVQARNDALRYMKEHLKAQLIEERQIVSTYQEQLRDLEDQNYSIGS